MERTIVTTLKEDFLPFASESLLNFLPNVADGLLPVHRKVIYALGKNGVTNDKSHIKMLRASAMAMSYYIFGDLPLNQAMKNMGNNSLNYMYLDPKGAFGDKQKKNGVGASARYIECKLSKYSEDLLQGIKKNSVPMKRNFDNTEDEPIVLPSSLPNILLNTTQSIATGEASKIPAHNLNEVCNAFINYIKTKDIDSTIDMINGCDLSLGGKIVYNKDEFRKIYTTGKGSFTLIGKYKFNEKENSISIYEIPYETYIEVLEDKIRQLYEAGKFKEIVDIHDGSDKDGLNLTIYLRKGTNVNSFIDKLRKLTPFESKMSCNFTCIDIDNKTPKLMSLQNIIESWVEHRKKCIKNELSYDIQQMNTELNKLKGLKVILEDLDKAIKIIRTSSNEDEVKEKLTNEFNLNSEQVNYVSTIKMINMNKDWISKKTLNVFSLEKNVDDYTNKLNDNEYILNVIIEQLECGKKKYGKPRMTEVIYNDLNSTSSSDILIEDYNCQLVVTKEGYIKKTLKYSDNQKLKDGDHVISQTQTTNKSKILAFTNLGNCYFYNTYDLNDTQPSNLGQYLPSLISLESDEKIIYTTVTSDFAGHLLFTYENGKVAKITLSSYKTETNRKRIKNAYNLNSKLVNVLKLTKDEDVMIKSVDNRYMVFNTSLLSEKQSTKSQGVNVISIKKGVVDKFEINQLCLAETGECWSDKIPKAGKKLDL